MYTLSLILNLHREGALAEQTILNLQHCIRHSQKAKNSWNAIEILAILDDPDERTKDIVHTYRTLFHKIEIVAYKDLAHARNHGVEIASHNFVLFADGDDYSSHNILPRLYRKFYKHYSGLINDTESLTQLPENRHIAVFPKYVIEFPNLFQMTFFDSNIYIVQNNKFLNCYPSKIAICKSVLQANKLKKNTPPYGYEDWDLNNRLLAKGIQYKTADYILYYRRGNRESLLSKQVGEKHIVRNSLLYSKAFNDTLTHKLHENDSRNINRIRQFILRPILFKVYRKIKYLVSRLLHSYLMPYTKKEPFSKEKKFLESYFENTLHLREDIQFSSTKHLASHSSIPTKIYNHLLEFLSQKEVVYFFPWIGMGGADKVSVEYTKALSIPNSCVITSIYSGPRIHAIKIPHLDLVSELEGWHALSEDEQMHILVKAMINSQIKLIHIVNSEIALKTVKYYDKVYKEYKIKTIVTLFCPDYDWINYEYHGYPVMYPELFEKADLVLSDNNYWYDFFKTLNHHKDFHYKKLSSPTQKMEISYHYKEKNTKKILWASRICNQKLFDVLEKIVNQLPEYTFVIYGSYAEGDQKHEEILTRLVQNDNVQFRGEYQHISEIDLNEFDLYLFTSLFEGIPTIILDMIMGGDPHCQC